MDYTRSDFKRQVYNLKSPAERLIERGVKLGFPNCKGCYDNCPEEPNEKESPCRSCPILEDINHKKKK